VAAPASVCAGDPGNRTAWHRGRLPGRDDGRRSSDRAALWTVLITLTTPTVTWLIVAVAMALGQLLTVFLRPIAPGQELEAIVT